MYESITIKKYEKKSKAKSSSKRLLILFLLLFITIFLTLSTKGSKPITYKNILVEKNDTLWSIVKENNHTGEDPRKMINEIKKINNLENVLLQPGQIIKLPKF